MVNYQTRIGGREFEKEFASRAGTKYDLALSNGTLAFDATLKVMGAGPGAEVVVTSRPLMANISSMVSAGAISVFADVELDSCNISAASILKSLTPHTKAVICAHLDGQPCDMDPTLALANQHGLKVIEDCAQALGARYKGRNVGSIGYVGAQCFCQDTIMSTGGEGDMVTTYDEALQRAMWSYKDHGTSYEAGCERQHPPRFRWVHESFGWMSGTQTTKVLSQT